MDKQHVKALIELAISFEEADEVMTKYTNCSTDQERIAYLKSIFNCAIVGTSVSDIHADYVALLTSIVGQKWRD